MTAPRRAATDRALVAAVVDGGDESAFRLLFQRHTPALYRIALRLTADVDGVAEDLVQETWMRASVRWESFAWRSSLRSWLTGILLNRVREVRRQRSRRPEADPFTDVDAHPTAESDADTIIDLARAIHRLPARYRAVIVLHDLEGFTHEEIAHLLGIEPGTSKSQLSRARRKLRAWLAPEGSAPR